MRALVCDSVHVTDFIPLRERVRECSVHAHFALVSCIYVCAFSNILQIRRACAFYILCRCEIISPYENVYLWCI